MLEISFIILSLAFLLLALFCAPLFWQMWRAAKNTAIAMESLNRSLPGILKNLEDITENVSRATCILEREVENLSLLGEKIRNIIAFSEEVEHLLQSGIKRPVLGMVKNVRGLVRGLSVFVDTLFRKE